jgi:hypothetical protein
MKREKKHHKNVGKWPIVIMSYSSNHPPARVVNEGKAGPETKDLLVVA